MKRIGRLSLLLVVGLLVSLSPWFVRGTSADDGPSSRQVIGQAWELAQASGRYRFRSLISQTTYLAPLLTNAGRPPRVTQLGLEGTVEEAAETLELMLWRDASFDPDKGVAIRVEGDRAYARTGQGEWEETENVANLFAPGGDPLSFLAAVRNIQEVGQGDNLQSPISIYHFDIDGAAFAEYMGEKIREQLAERGELPPGISLGTPDYYRQMTGTGEIWLDAAGLPSRLTVQLDMGEQENGERITAEIRHDLYGFDTARIEQSQVGLLTDGRAWFDYHIAGNVAAFQKVALRFDFLLFVLVAAFVVVRYRENRRLYTGVVGFVIGAMLAGPLLQAHHVEAFGEVQQTRKAAAEERQAKAEQFQQAQAAQTNSDWNPNQNPLETYSVLRIPYQDNTQYAIRNTQYAIRSSTTITTTDTDGDGLSDADEASWLTCAYSGAPNFCSGVSDPADSDGDGLSDGIEVNNLGILPTQTDTDSDSIYDSLEVKGFDYNGTTWYLDPNESDTNGDGILDGPECTVLSDSNDGYNPAGICEDTDDDGTPDIFDEDNDGDGVEDAVDLSPWSVSAETYDDDNPLAVTVNNLQTNVPVLLEIQFRPTHAEHLTYSNLVLDWPSGDTEGQVTRYLDSTFASTSNSDILSSDPNAANGDVRIIPMLEITMPYNDDGHYANLPVKSAYINTLRYNGLAVEDWLDETELDPYAITVRDVDELSGDLVAYIPLNTISSSAGDETQAYGATMVYYPTQGTAGIANWGAAHEFRVIWWVQMISDSCIDPDDDAATCAREDSLSLIQTYEEEWTLTGLDVSEEHGLDVALVYENPALDDNLSQDDEVWSISWNLGNTFINGRDCDTTVAGECQGDGERDVTVANLESQIDDWSNGTSFAEVDTFGPYPHQGYITTIMMTETVNILDTVFTSYADETYPIILVAQENEARVANLDDEGSLSGSALTVNFSGLETQTTTAISWANYQYVDSAWQNMDAEDYLTILEWQLQNDDFFQAADSSTESTDEAEGKRIWAQIYYVALLNGLVGLAAIANESVWVSSETEVVEAVYTSAWANVSFSGVGWVAYLFFVTFTAALISKISSVSTISFWAQMKYSFSYNTSLFGASTSYLKFFKWTSSMTVGMACFLAAGVLAVVGATLFLVGYNSGNESLMKTGTILLNVSAVIFQATWMLGMISTMYRAYQAGGAFFLLSRLTQITNTYRNLSIITLIITLAIIWGYFFYKWITGSIKPGTFKFDLLLAYSIAASIVAIAFTILSLNPFGAILIGLLILVDAILRLIGVKSIQDRITEWIAKGLYDVDVILANLDESDRLELGDAEMAFADDEAGFMVSNSFYYTLSVTNTIEVADEELNYSDGLKTTFAYVLQPTQVDQHEDLELGMMEAGWHFLYDDTEYDDFGLVEKFVYGMQMFATAALTQPLGFSAAGTGINQNFDGSLYFTEAYAAPYRACWQLIEIEFDCDWYHYNGSNHVNLGTDIVFDIFPGSLIGFVDLGWSGGALAFPEQSDHDGDGLYSGSAGGADPNDRAVDSDGDGLTDSYEITNGLDASAADGDEDGLDDMAELAYSTNPYAADSDDDGLSDYTELITGWLVVYDTATNAVTRVWSDPNMADEDGDTLNDMEEFIFAFHPQVETDPSVIQDIIAFDNITVDETESPLLLLQFEETEGVSAFADSSGQGYTAACDTSAARCPTAASSGRYGSAVLFDGSNDYLDTEENVVNLAKADFSIGAWVRTSSTGRGIVTLNDGDNSWEQGEKSFYLNGSGRPTFVGFGNAYIQSTTAVNNGQWHHVMVVWDYSGSGTSGTGKMYVDGVDVTNATTNYAANNADKSGATLKIGRPNHNAGEAPNYFNGRLDEVIVYDRALAAAEVLDVMYGRYNPNDLTVLPGQELTYQATVTNTHPLQESNGFLVADSTYYDPALTTPETVLRFESEDFVTSFSNGVGESSTAYCLGDGSCPNTGLEGKYGDAVQFDGLNDLIEFPSMGDSYEEYSLAFWLNVSALPAAGSTAAILTSDRTDNGRLNVYLNSSGNIVFDILGADALNTSSYSFSSNLNAWHHVAFIYLKSSDSFGFSEVYIDASAIGADYDSRVSYSVPQELLVGPGRLGNNLTGTAPYNGKLDDIVFYNGDTIEATPQSQNDELHYVYAGSYTIKLTGYGPLRPSFLLKFEDIGQDYAPTSFDADQTGVADAVCQTTATCPLYTDSGYDGGALVFDGSDDYLYTAASHNDRETDVTFYAKIDTWPSSGTTDYFLDTDSSSTSAIDLYLNSSGKLVVQRGTTSITSLGTVATGSWKKIKVSFEWGSDGLNFYYRAKIYFNDVLDSTQNLCYGSSSLCPSTIRALIGGGRIGNNTAATAAFDGTLDEFAIESYASYSFDAGDPAAVALVNRVNDGQLANCADFITCPNLDSAGVFGSALSFDGDDYLTLENESAYDFSQVTVAVWIKVQPGDFTKSWQAIVTKGDDAWRLHRYSSTSRVAFSTDGLSNGDLASTSSVDDGQWHHIVGVFDGATKYIYVDGVLENSVAVTGDLATDSYDVQIGANQQQANRYFKGLMDEVVILPEAVSAEAVELLMNSTWPAISPADDFTALDVPALSTVVVSSTAGVDENTPSSQHQFNEEVEVALALQADIPIPIVDGNAADLQIFMPFEDVPGVTDFENIVDSYDTSCSGDRCPQAGLRGLIDRAAYFDGLDDSLTIADHNYLGNTYAVWVKADQGTIIDTRDRQQDHGLTLDVNRLFLAISRQNDSTYYQTYELPFDIPENEWTHVAAVFDSSTGKASVYINGSLTVSTTTVFPNNSQNRVDREPLTIGANVDSSDPLRGYLDDLRIYDSALAAADIQTLYEDSAALMRFEFDEDGDATSFADSSLNDYTGSPTLTACADFNLMAVSPSIFMEDDVAYIYIAVNDEWLFYEPYVAEHNFPYIGTTICGTSTVSAGAVRTSGVAFEIDSVTVDPTVIEEHFEVFFNSQNQVISVWDISNTFYVPNPVPGTDGQIGNTALFDGEGTIEVADAASVGEFAKADFAIAVWIKTTATSAGIVVKNDGDSSWEQGEKAFYLDSSGRPAFVGWGNNWIKTSTAVNDDIWHQVAVTWDYSGSGTAGTGKIYVDGIDVTNTAGTTYGAYYGDNSGNTIKIGATNYNSPEAPNNFVGQLDELAIYGRTLTAAEIYSIYLREVRWYRDRSSSLITVDDDAPYVELLSDAGYRANDYIQLAVAVTDTTSAISLVDFGLKTPGDSSFSWEGATRCLDSSSAWCPAFDPSALDGEGTYEVQFRVVDSVGNETTSSSYTLYVDDSAPTAGSSYTGGWQTATTDPADELRWTVSLSGSISDPNLSGGAAGSGVYTPTVTVELVDGRGETAGGSPQTATVNGTTWAIVYEVTGLRPVGTFTVTVTAEDQVGNSASSSVGKIKLDERPSEVKVNWWQLPENRITTTLTLNGVVGDMPNWNGAVLQLHLEEAAGATTFYDYGQSQNNATCSGTTCPTGVTGGPFGRALEFDGSNDRLFVDAHDNLNIGPAVSLALWVNPDTNTGHVRRYISLGADKAVLRMENNNRLDFYVQLNGTNRHIRITGVMTTGEWQHVAGTYDGTTMRLYRNGIEIGSLDVTGTVDSTSYVNIGSSSEQFDGKMDEILIYGRALTEGEVYALAQKDVAGVSSVEVALEQVDFSNLDIVESLNWQAATLAQASGGATTWSYTIPAGLENFYQIHLRSTDAAGNQDDSSIVIWRGVIDNLAPRLSFTGQHIGGGTAAQTQYVFTAGDLFINDGALTQPCTINQLDEGYYSNPARLNQLSATCEVAGHVTTPVTVKACDYGGLCTTITLTPSSSPAVASVAILSPTNRSSWHGLAPVTLSGGAYAPTGIQNITINVNGVPINTITPGGGTTDTPWTTPWTPTAPGTYTITAVMNSGTAAGEGVGTDTPSETAVVGPAIEGGVEATYSDTVVVTITADPTAITMSQLRLEQQPGVMLLVVGLMLLLAFVTWGVWYGRRPRWMIG